MKKFRKNLTLLVSVLTILAMALVGCSSNSGGSGGGGSPNGGSGSGSSPNGGSSTVAVTGVKLSPQWKNIYKGETTTLTAIVSPSNATNKAVTWKSSNPSVATVDNNGKVTGVDGGSTLITATTSDGSHTDTVWITVKVPVSVSLDKTSETIDVAGSTFLMATVSPSNASNKEITWKSSNPAVAKITVYNYNLVRVTGVSAGSAKITATTVHNHTATATITVKPVAVTGVRLHKTSETIYVGETTTLGVIVDPINATNKAVTWKSDKPSVATVDNNGKVTGVDGGTAKITVTTVDGGKTGTATITVKVHVKSVSLNKTSETIYVGETTTLTATVAPSNATNQAVTWSSSNPSVATVDNNGKVTGVDGGTATITVKTEDGSKTATADITVKVHVASVSLNKNSVSIEATGSYTSDKLTATVLPSNATNKAVTWKSDKPSVATVDTNGTVTAVRTGVAKITVTTADGSKTATATVTVSQEWDVLASTITVPTKGSTPITFPMDNGDTASFDNLDDGTGTIKHKFALAKTEVTYELWKKVYDWANKGSNTCNTATGQYCYTFANEGWKGGTGSYPSYASNTGGTVKQPVTKVSWRDAVVWSNAYTEWYNAEKGGSLTVVYYTDATYTTPLRTSTNDTPQSNPTAGSEDQPYIKASSYDNTDMANNTATGFRLPTSVEWEFAARLRKDNATNNIAHSTSYPLAIGGTQYWFTKGDSASGAKANYQNATETGKVAWYTTNSCDDGTGCSRNSTGTKQSKTRDVATRTPNALGLYDMSGNVYEWCFDVDVKKSSKRVNRGGCWDSSARGLQVGFVYGDSPSGTSSDLGFRLARSLP